MRLPKIIKETLRDFRQASSDLPHIGIPSPEADRRAVAELEPYVIEEFLEDMRRNYFASQVGAVASTQLELDLNLKSHA